MEDAAQVTVALIVLATAALWLCGDKRLARVGAALLANWIVCTGWVLLTGNYYAWGWFMFVDTLSAFYVLVLLRPCTHVQAIIGGFYVAQVAFHGTFGVGVANGDTYLTALDLLGRAQLAALIIGGGYGLVARLHRRSHRPAGNGVAVAARGSRMDGSRE